MFTPPFFVVTWTWLPSQVFPVNSRFTPPFTVEPVTSPARRFRLTPPLVASNRRLPRISEMLMPPLTVFSVRLVACGTKIS